MQWWIGSNFLTGPICPLHKVACSLGNLSPPSCSDPCTWIHNSTLWSVGDNMMKFPGSYLKYRVRMWTIRSASMVIIFSHRCMWFLGEFARFRKAIISFFTSFFFNAFHTVVLDRINLLMTVKHNKCWVLITGFLKWVQ